MSPEYPKIPVDAIPAFYALNKEIKSCQADLQLLIMSTRDVLNNVDAHSLGSVVVSTDAIERLEKLMETIEKEHEL